MTKIRAWMGSNHRPYHSTPHCTIHSTNTDTHRQCIKPWYFNPKSPACIILRARVTCKRGHALLPITEFTCYYWKDNHNNYYKKLTRIKHEIRCSLSPADQLECCCSASRTRSRNNFSLLVHCCPQPRPLSCP